MKEYLRKKMTTISNVLVFLSVIIIVQIHQTESQPGPDPWHYDYDNKPPQINDEFRIPPDIRMQAKMKAQIENKLSLGEWFFRRMLSIILKGGQSQHNEDGSIDISVQMKFDPAQWKTLEECMKSETPLSEDMLRKSMGYVQDSIYTPSIVEKIVMAWSDYASLYLTEYKTYITWTLVFLSGAGGILWLWSHMSHRHVIIVALLIFYAYEVVISYKEAEQKELDKFLAAVDQCKWFFWRSSCEVPAPDPLVFLKHMNPLRIAVRMFTTALAEPIVAIGGTVEVMLHGFTDGLWYPFNNITYGVLTVVVNISLIYFLIMVIFNWLLNIPFRLGFGLFSVNIQQRERRVFQNEERQDRVQDNDRINQSTIDRLLDVCTLALSNNQNNRMAIVHQNRSNVPQNRENVTNMKPSNKIFCRSLPIIRRSASTGRLPDLSADNNLALDAVRRRRHDGSGDASNHF